MKMKLVVSNRQNSATASSGDRATPIMVQEEEEEADIVDCNSKAKTVSYSNHRRAEEVAVAHEFQCADEPEILQQPPLFPKKEQEEVTWTWKRQQMQGFCAPIGLMYRKKVFKDIRSVLTAVGGKKLLQQFLDGCFGHLMHFIGGTSCGKALHELISHEIILPSAREDELWFHISGTNIRFAPAEYALVTGLHFGSFSFDPLGSHEMPPDGVYERLCSGRPIMVKLLWEQFNLQRVRGSAEDYLKVAHILALNLMVLGYNVYRTVDEWMWVLVEDLDLWNKFPWGAYSYKALMYFASILPKTRATKTGIVQNYKFSGPVWALQIWAYEAIPHLGNMCALVTGQFTMPRCLKWSFLARRYIDFAHFSEQELVCSVTLEPTDEEQLQPYWVSVQTPQPLGVQYAFPWKSNRIWNLQGALQGAEPGVHCFVASARREKVPFSSDHTGSVSASLQQPRRSSRLASPVEASSAEPVKPSSTPAPSARREKVPFSSDHTVSVSASPQQPRRSSRLASPVEASSAEPVKPSSTPAPSARREKVPFSSDHTGSVSASPQQPRRSSRLTSLVEASSAEPIKPSNTPAPSAHPKRTWASTCPTPLSGNKHIRPQHVPEWPEVSDEARSVDQVSGRVVDRLIEPVADRVIEPLATMVTQRLIEPVVERLSQQLIPHMKQWVEDLFHQTKKSRRSPSSSDDEGSESSSGDERRKRCQKKKAKYSESSSSESSDSSETSDSDAR